MASHLTVTSKSPTGTASTKALSGQGGAEAENGVMGAFAAMLGGTEKATGTKQTTEAKLELSLSKLASLVLGKGNDGEAANDAENPDATAAVIDAVQPIQTPDEAKALLTDLINNLAAVKQALDGGETVDPELLETISGALDTLATKFNIDLSAQPSLEDLTALTTAIIDGDVSATAQVTTALAPLLQTLLSGEAGPSASADLSAAVKAVGEKLVSLLQTLNSDDISADDLATLGLKADTGFDADLEAALTKLVNQTAKVDGTTASQQLATPTLQLTEPTLTGKAQASATTETDAPAQPDKVSDGEIKLTPVASDAKDSGRQDKSDDKPANDKSPATVAAPAANEARTEPLAATAAAPQAVRVDAAAPRVVQVGYQTSQQQLNLPQLAFELVRQVTDGNTRFQLRLDPPELGRIDVKLDIDKSGQVNARLVVEKSETLDLMQRDQRALERALQQAGLEGSKTNLEFSLKQNPFSGGQQQGRDSQEQFSLDGMGLGDSEETPPTVNLYRGSLTASGVNIIA